jgi:glycosyltransferase involved in cell wall biosynthesis
VKSSQPVRGTALPGRGGRKVVRALREAPGTAQVTEDALSSFGRAYPDAKIEPLVVVIAAYNEAGNIGAVLDEIPAQIAGIQVTRLVVDDGSTDATSDVAARHGALVCRLPVNRGHGVALRLGYRIARDHGARYIATLDGDGQWDPADLPAMVSLLEQGHADFVVGSRQLGQTQNTDLMRNAGVRFFAWLVSRLTGAKVTDTSSGLRVMTAHLTGAVRQTQPQYQTSELLIGAILHGYRVAEVPTTMRPRISGASKKGRNITYGLRYARVIITTWRRERRDAHRSHVLQAALAGFPLKEPGSPARAD